MLCAVIINNIKSDVYNSVIRIITLIVINSDNF